MRFGLDLLVSFKKKKKIKCAVRERAFTTLRMFQRTRHLHSREPPVRPLTSSERWSLRGAGTDSGPSKGKLRNVCSHTRNEVYSGRETHMNRKHEARLGRNDRGRHLPPNCAVTPACVLGWLLHLCAHRAQWAELTSVLKPRPGAMQPRTSMHQRPPLRTGLAMLV